MSIYTHEYESISIYHILPIHICFMHKMLAEGEDGERRMEVIVFQRYH